MKVIDLANCSKTKNCPDSGGHGPNNFDQKELILVEFYHSSSQSFALFVFDCHLMFFKGWHAVACPQSVRSKLMILYISFLLFSSLLFSFSPLLSYLYIFHHFLYFLLKADPKNWLELCCKPPTETMEKSFFVQIKHMALHCNYTCFKKPYKWWQLSS